MPGRSPRKSGKRSTVVRGEGREEARRLLSAGLRACSHCRPDVQRSGLTAACCRARSPP
ncbi:DUF6233 domain-containing protein [Streptomyces swartbergensis]|uniref:DUF6233 domain-containing protein n=1 Tax=Streptomyces swartbergensis TaxID=487165 RepID=UPI003CC631C5